MPCKTYSIIILVQAILSAVECYHPHYGVFFDSTPPSGGPLFPQPNTGFDVPGGESFISQPTGIPSASDPSGLGCGTIPASCPLTKYRSYDGTCNNLRNPVVGTSNTPYTRLLPSQYGDGISTPTLAKSGHELPGARVVSLRIYPDLRVEDPLFTLNAMQYGQIITHDMSLLAGSTQAQPHQTRCCTDDGQFLELANIPEHCYPIVVPDNDPVHSRDNVKCMNFVKTITNRDRSCVGGLEPAEQLTSVNNYLDLSLVYGSTVEVNRQVRLFQFGRLRVDIRKGQQWPPRSLNASGICSLRNPQDACYLAGDSRSNQNPQLTLLQIIFLREHNRLADALGKLNPHWSDEVVFQEARKINIAQHQHITYYEWLPIFIGYDNCVTRRLTWYTDGYVNDYDDDIYATVLNEHATTAFRYFHTLIAGNLHLVTENRKSRGSLRLSDWFNKPQILEEGNNFDDLTRGLATQPELAADQFHDSEITQYLFRDRRQFGFDLKAIDIQRNRDHGLASYNDYRQFCGLRKATCFEDFLDVMSKENVQHLSSLYECVDDVDLTVGGSLEFHVPGTHVGPTFLCIITEQFYRTRVGDRFWFENGGETGFSLDQLFEIRKSSISRLLCDNGYNIRAMQPRGFEIVSQSNAVVPCEKLPALDLTLWKEVQGRDVGYEDQLQIPHNIFYKK